MWHALRGCRRDCTVALRSVLSDARLHGIGGGHSQGRRMFGYTENYITVPYALS